MVNSSTILTSDWMQDRQLSIETQLKKEVEAAHAKLASARLGFKAESEMFQESVERLGQQDRTIQVKIFVANEEKILEPKISGA